MTATVDCMILPANYTPDISHKTFRQASGTYKPFQNVILSLGKSPFVDLLVRYDKDGGTTPY